MTQLTLAHAHRYCAPRQRLLKYMGGMLHRYHKRVTRAEHVLACPLTCGLWKCDFSRCQHWVQTTVKGLHYGVRKPTPTLSWQDDAIAKLLELCLNSYTVT
jgi:hypothetical protein